MKNIFRTLAAIALIATTASCSKDGAEALAPQGGKATVSFDVQLPGGIVGRATNDGTTANKLYYAVYTAGEVDKRGNLIETMNGVQDITISTTVQLDLVANQKYDIVFWAQAEGKYAPEFGSKVIEMGYADGVKGSDEERDAFISVVDNLTVNGASTQTVVMKRPFAQLNIGLTAGQIAKAEKAGFKLAKVQVTAQTYNTFSFETGVDYAAGTPTDELQTIKFEAADYTQNVTIEVNNNTYDWVSFNYLLADTPSDLSVVKVTFIDTEGDQIALPAFTNVPVERNHRTNIVGDLLTDPTNFNVTIDPTFDEPENSPVEEQDKVQVSTVAELKAALAAEAEIIYLANGVYEGVFLSRSYEHTIIAANAGQATIKGLFGVAKDITFRGLNFEVSADTNSKTGHQYVDKGSGYIIPIYCANVTVEDCAFTGMTDDNGAISYVSQTEGAAVAEKLTVKNSTFNGGRAIRSRSNVTVTGCSFTGLVNPCLQVLGLGNNNVPSTVEFTNNISTDKFIDGVTIKTSNYPTKNITFNVGGNTNCNIITYDSKNLSNLYPDTYTYTGEITEIVPEGTAVGVSSQAALNDAIANGATTIYVAEGEFQLPSSVKNTDGVITFIGTGVNSVLETTSNPGGADGGLGHYAHNMDLVFENLTLETDGSVYGGGFGFVKSVVFNNCQLIGQYRMHGPHVFNKCTIDPKTGYVYTDCKNATFTDCLFSASEGKALQVYADANSGESVVNITNCQFVAAKQAQTWDGKPVTGIDINSDGEIFTVNITGSTFTGFPTGLNSGNNMWNIKGGAQYVTIYLDGVQQ